jgi:ABC-type nitrate/sulfonate/bicarbonate transport system substrate-binding protein
MNSMAVRIVSRVVALIAFVALTVTTAGAQANVVELTFGNLGPNAFEWPIYIAQSQSYFRDEGLRVAVVAFNGPQDAINAVATGAVNLADDQTDTAISAIAHGIDIRIVSPQFRVVSYRLAVNPSITSWQQLRTATVSLGSKVGSSDISYRRLLRAHGVSDTDIAIVVAGNSTLRLAALKSGNVAATMLAPPFDALAESQGMRIMADADEVMHKDWVWSAIMVGNTWGNANRATIVHFLRAFRRAIAYGYTHREECLALLEANVKVDRPTAEKSYDLAFTKWKGFERDLRIDPAALTNIANALIGYGSITKAPTVAEMYDPSYAQAALR